MKRVCGLDVHKDNAFVCILGENGEKIEFKTGVLTVELDSFRNRLVELGVGEVAMESTAVYWMPIWRILESDFKLYLVNPLSIKQLPGRKSDVKDAEWIATCLQKGLIRGSFVPPLAVQQLRQYNRRLFDLNKQAVYVQNKMDAALQRCNIRISNYVSNVDTKGYREVVELLSEGTTDPELLTGKIHRRTVNKHGRDTIKAALTGVVTDVDSDLLRQYREELDLLRRHKLECLSKMREMCEELYPEELKRIEEIPGISAQSATQIIAEIGADMKMFLTARTLVAWAGLKPRNDGSNGKSSHAGSPTEISISGSCSLNAHGRQAARRTASSAASATGWSPSGKKDASRCRLPLQENCSSSSGIYWPKGCSTPTGWHRQTTPKMNHRIPHKGRP